jgi:exodeoxyribonuclease VII large subunit
LPGFPTKIGVATSPTGAAIRDIIQVIRRRAPWVEILLRPTRVQGEGSAEDIARAVEELNEFGDLDVIIVGRGGGSVEDLWAFNEELVARSIFHSRIPVISAVGHEIDHTISDLVADLRAPTPSAAAEMIAPDARALAIDVARLRSRLATGMRTGLRLARSDFRGMAERWRGLRFEMSMAQLQQRPDELVNRAVRALGHGMEIRRRELGSLASRLQGVSPLAVLARGYCLCRRLPALDVVTRAVSLAPKDEVLIKFHEGEAVCSVAEVRGSKEGRS